MFIYWAKLAKISKNFSTWFLGVNYLQKNNYKNVQSLLFT